MDCGCEAPYIGPPLDNTCGGSSFVLFMSLLNTFITNKCDISEICQRVQPKVQPEPEYDFVVLGGGTAGSVVAARLSEIPNWKVLLIEAGNDEPPGSQVPAMVSNYFEHPHMDYNYKTEPESSACLGYPEQRCSWIRAKVLGGCSVINGMMYARGVPKDYDNWAKAGNQGWSHREFLPYFLKAENNTQIGTLVDAQYHTTGGPMTVQRFPDQPDLAWDILEGAKELGYPVSNDLNGAQFQGFAVAQANVRDGARLSTARAYLRPARNRPNLHIMLNSTATKILINQSGNKKIVSGVQFLYKNKLHTVRVKREVVVSGGAVNSPQILLLSGIGPKEELDKVNIQQVHQLPGVGKNLHNHVAFYLTFLLKKKKAIHDLDWAVALDYIVNKKGPMSSTGMSQVTARINTRFADPSGIHPDLQIFFGGYTANCAASGVIKAAENEENPDAPRHLTMSPVVLHPKSRGYIGLKSSNPLDPPLIKANYLVEPEDVQTLIEGVRILLKLANTTVLKNKYGIELDKEEYGDCAKQHPYDSDDFWECAVRYYTGPENHQVGSCKMGPASDPNAVVDPQLQVHGIDGLRVMDASIMPAVLSGNTAATCVAIAEKGVDMIKQKWQPQVTLTDRFGTTNPNFNNHKSTQRPIYNQTAFNNNNNNFNHYPPYNAPHYNNPSHGPYPNQPPYIPSHHNNPPQNPHGNKYPSMQHSPEFHRNHPNLPNPFQTRQNRSVGYQGYYQNNKGYQNDYQNDHYPDY